MYNTVPKEIDFPCYTMKCSGENVILRVIFHVVSCFPLHFMLHRGHLDYFLDSECPPKYNETVLLNPYIVCLWKKYTFLFIYLFYNPSPLILYSSCSKKIYLWSCRIQKIIFIGKIAIAILDLFSKILRNLK